MPSPFPGMDPYLEDDALWPAFHHQLVLCLYQILLPGLVDRYRARIAQRQYVTEQALFTSVVREEHHEEYVEIRQRSDGRLVTLLDVVSPANKVTDAGRQSLPGQAPRGPRRRRQPRRDGPRLAGPADAGLLARRPARLGLRRHRDPRRPSRSATRFTPRPCKSACRASACRWRPTTATRSSTCTRRSRAATTRATSPPRSTTSATPPRRCPTRTAAGSSTCSSSRNCANVGW